MTILADTSRIMPHDVFLHSFGTGPANGGMSLHITGEALDYKTVGTFMEDIREQTGWAQMSTPGTVSSIGSPLTGGQRVSFNLNIPIRDLYGGDL